MKFKRYVYGNTPELVPVNDESVGLPLGPGEDTIEDFEKKWGETLLAAGFDPDDEEITVVELAEDWEGHPAGSLVVTGCTVEGHPFAIETGD